jgi:hypothetical protein
MGGKREKGREKPPRRRRRKGQGNVEKTRETLNLVTN